MTNHHDELRVAPDPARAEELRRRLHARLASGSRHEPVAPTQDALVSVPSVDADPDDREGDVIMLETEDRPTSDQPAVPRRRSPRRWLVVAAAAAVVAVVGTLLVAAAVDDDDKQIDAVDFPNLTTTFVSPTNGFSVRHLDRRDGTVTPAIQLLGFSEQVDDGFDVVDTGLAAVFKGASTAIPEGPRMPPGLSTDEWIDDYPDDSGLPGGCGVPRSQQAEITIDGQAGRIAECANRIEATVVAGGRLYLFTLLHDRGDARAVFDAFVATIDLTPETAVTFPVLTGTFVSPTYGFSFKYFPRGLIPATQLWDPVNQQSQPPDHEGRFDWADTGHGAAFAGASTALPEGVSIDAWVDEYLSPGREADLEGGLQRTGCGVPRSQQAEITIDGQSGRIAECAETIEATVVADGRLYLFFMIGARPDAREFFDAWIATIDLTPETAT